MSRSVARNADRHARTLLKQNVSILKQHVLNAAALQRFLSSLWRARAITAAIASQREKQLLNNILYNIFALYTAGFESAVFSFILLIKPSAFR